MSETANSSTRGGVGHACAGVITLEFLFILPLLMALLYGGMVYGILFFHKQEMQQVVDRASASVYSLDRRRYTDFGPAVIQHSEAVMSGLVATLPDTIRTRIAERECAEMVSSGVILLECRLLANAEGSPFLPQLNLGFLGVFPPQPGQIEVRAAVAY